VAIGGFKVALCLSYLRYLSNTNKRAYRITVWSVLAFCVATRVAIIGGLIFNCRPISKGWSPKTPGTCIPILPFYYSDAAFTILGDLAVFFLPIPMVMGLRIRQREKYSLAFAFLLGLVTTVFSIMRILQIPEVADHSDSTMVVLWGLMEANAGVSTHRSPLRSTSFAHFVRNLDHYDLPTSIPSAHQALEGTDEGRDFVPVSRLL
jgi:hypothetical protein